MFSARPATGFNAVSVHARGTPCAGAQLLWLPVLPVRRSVPLLLAIVCTQGKRLYERELPHDVARDCIALAEQRGEGRAVTGRPSESTDA